MRKFISNALISMFFVSGLQMPVEVPKIPPEMPQEAIIHDKVVTEPIIVNSPPEVIQAPLPLATDVELIILLKASKYRVDPYLALGLAMYESNMNPLAENPTSTATGIYQFIFSTWESLCEGSVTSTEDNAECAMRIISEGGIGHWTADGNT